MSWRRQLGSRAGLYTSPGAGSQDTGSSDQPVLAEREARPVANDEVIEHPHVQQGERLLETAGNELIRLARLEHARRVVVGEDHRRGVVVQRLAQDLARVHAGSIDGAAKQLLEGNQP